MSGAIRAVGFVPGTPRHGAARDGGYNAQAVLRDSGRWTQANYQRHLAGLQQTLSVSAGLS